MYKKSNFVIIIASIILSLLISLNIKQAIADGYQGLIPAQNQNKNRPATNNNISQPNEQPSGAFSFISPGVKGRNQQPAQQQPVQQQNPQFQGYQSFDSYESYYKEQQQNQTQQAVQPVSPIMPNVAAPINTQTAVPDANAYVPSTVALSPENKRTLSMLNLRSSEGLPKTANIRRRILATLEKMEQPNLSRKQKQDLVRIDIVEFEKLKAGLESEREYADDIYAKMDLPANYVAQLKQDNADSLQLLEQALIRFSKY